MKVKRYILNCLSIITLIVYLVIPSLGYASPVKDSRQKRRNVRVETRRTRPTRTETYRTKTYRTTNYKVSNNKSFRKREPEYTKPLMFTSKQKIYIQEEAKDWGYSYNNQETNGEKSRLGDFFRDVKKPGPPSDGEYEYNDYWRYYLLNRYYWNYRRPYRYSPYSYGWWDWNYPYSGSVAPYGPAYGERFGEVEKYRTAIENRASLSLIYQKIDTSIAAVGAEFNFIRSRNMGFSLGWCTYEEKLGVEKNRLTQLDASFLYEFIPMLSGEVGLRALYYEDESALGFKLGVRAKLPLTRNFNLWVKPNATLFSDGTLIGFSGGFSFNVISLINLVGSYRSLISSTESLSGPSIGLTLNFK